MDEVWENNNNPELTAKASDPNASEESDHSRPYSLEPDGSQKEVKEIVAAPEQRPNNAKPLGIQKKIGHAKHASNVIKSTCSLSKLGKHTSSNTTFDQSSTRFKNSANKTVAQFNSARDKTQYYNSLVYVSDCLCSASK